MARWIRHRKRIEARHYTHSYEWRDCSGGGFSFDADERGVIDESKLCPEALVNLAFCRAEAVKPNGKVIDRSLISWLSHYIQPGVIECSVCHHHVMLEFDTAYCDCGQPYNLSGQEINPDVRAWGEETGEHWCDIVNHTPVEDY